MAAQVQCPNTKCGSYMVHGNGPQYGTWAGTAAVGKLIAVWIGGDPVFRAVGGVLARVIPNVDAFWVVLLGLPAAVGLLVALLMYAVASKSGKPMKCINCGMVLDARKPSNDF